jgi:hypothetical protein
MKIRLFSTLIALLPFAVLAPLTSCSDDGSGDDSPAMLSGAGANPAGAATSVPSGAGAASGAGADAAGVTGNAGGTPGAGAAVNTGESMNAGAATNIGGSMNTGGNAAGTAGSMDAMNGTAGMGSGGSTAGGSGGGASDAMGGMGAIAMGGAPATMDGPAPTLATLEEVIVFFGCNGACCHGGNAEITPLDLRIGDDLLENLTTTVSAKCDNLPVVAPGNPEGSALIRLLKGECGGIQRMPAGCFETEAENNCTPDDYIAAIEQWVRDGALP